MKKVVFIILCFVISGNAFSVIPGGDPLIVKHGPEYMLPSPEAISRIKHIARPTGLYTGIPEIAIPVWNNSMCSYAINLRYHAGGIQMNELASSVGLGWSLETGSVIARVVRGLPDDLAEKGYLYLPEDLKVVYDMNFDELVTNYNINFAGFDALYNIQCPGCFDLKDTTINHIGDLYDPAPDIFYYNLNGMTGKFVFDQDGKIVTIPRSNLSIIPGYSDNGEIAYFIIKTAQGVSYKFYMPERITINSIGGNQETGENPETEVDLGYTKYNSAWHLGDGMTISRGEVSYEYNTVTSTLYRDLYQFKYTNQTGQEVTDVVHANLTIERPQIIRISDANSVAEFTYGANNELTQISISGVYPNIDPVEKCKVADIQFIYDEFTSSTFTVDRKRRLSKVKIGRLGEGEETDVFDVYQLSYDTTIILPVEYSVEQDLWGFYNGNSETTLLPELNYINEKYESIGITTPADISGADRTANSATIEAGMLVKIENPQGGITEYDYEPQSFYYSSQNITGGGVRIKSISYYDQDSEYATNTVNYSYNFVDNESISSGELISKANFAYNLHHRHFIEENTFHVANMQYGLIMPFGNPVYYKQVKVANGLGYTINDFELQLPDTTINDTLYQSDGLLREDTINHSTHLSYKGNEYRNNYSYELTNVYPIRVRSYDAQDTKLTETVFYYKTLQNLDLINGFIAGPNLNSIKNTRELQKFHYPVAWKLLEQKEVSNYVNGNPFTNTTTYEYHETFTNFRFLKGIQTSDANGNTHFKRILYTFNYDLDEYHLNDEIETYKLEVEALLSDNNYRSYSAAQDFYVLNKNVELDTIPDEPEDLINADPEVVALATMLNQENFSTPVEIIEGIEINGQKKIKSATLRTFKKFKNIGIVPDKEYILSGPIDYMESDISRVDPQSDAFIFNNKYQLANSYTHYNGWGDVHVTVDAGGINTEYEWSKYGNYLMSKTVNGTHTVSYEYKPLVGVINQTDLSGNKFYYIYDTQGKLVAKKDSDKNIRELYNYHAVNNEGEQQVDESTDEDGIYNYTSDAMATLIHYSNPEDEGFKVHNYNPIFNYEIDFGDGTSTSFDQANINHTYSLSGYYTVKLFEKKNGVVLNQNNITIKVTVEVQQ